MTSAGKLFLIGGIVFAVSIVVVSTVYIIHWQKHKHDQYPKTTHKGLHQNKGISPINDDPPSPTRGPCPDLWKQGADGWDYNVNEAYSTCYAPGPYTTTHKGRPFATFYYNDATIGWATQFNEKWTNSQYPSNQWN